MKPRFIAIGASILALLGLVFTVLSAPTITVVPAAPLPIQMEPLESIEPEQSVPLPPIQVPGVPTVIQVAPGAPVPGPVLKVLPPLPVIDPPPKPKPAPTPVVKPASELACEPACEPVYYQPHCWGWRRCR